MNNSLKDYVLFPLGIRCNSASIIKNDFNNTKESYPFSWIDIQLKNMLSFLSVPHDQITQYLTIYFKSFDKKTLRSSVDDTWFPHDFKEKKEPITAKYLRRFKRMYSLFDSGNDILFLTTIAHFKSDQHNLFEKIKSTVCNQVKGKCFFLTVNLYNFDSTDKNHINFYVPISDTWADYDKIIAEKIKLLL